MAIETPSLLDAVLATDLASDCVLDGSPSTSFRLLFTSPSMTQDEGTGAFLNTKPTAECKASDAALVVPESTVLTIDGSDYIAERVENVDGGTAWKMLVLREV